MYKMLKCYTSNSEYINDIQTFDPTYYGCHVQATLHGTESQPPKMRSVYLLPIMPSHRHKCLH